MSASRKVTPLQQEGDFGMLVSESVMTSIEDLLSRDAMEALVSYVPPRLVVNSPQEFHSKLAEILHDGAEILEYLVLKDLAERLGIQAPTEDNVDIVDFMERGRAAAFSGRGAPRRS